jgi:mannosyltransferase OCH1-like enzyme
MTIHFLAPEDKDKWEPIWDKCFNTWAQTSYDLNVWTDEGIDKLLKEDDDEFYINYLSNLHPIYKFDYVRYLILEKYMGIYIDIDIKLIKDFIPLLDPTSIYLAEGTSGNYVENCLMVASNNKHYSSAFFERVKEFCKDKIKLNYSKCLKHKRQVVYNVGARALSEFVITQHKFFKVNINRLAYEHFGSLENTLSFTKHYYTNSWLK